MVKKKVAKVLAFRYMILAGILVILAGGLVLLPKYEKHEGIKTEQLLSNIISPERYISTDNLADKLINQDPSYLLIDVRDEKSFNKYTLPNAINIPLAKLLDEDSEMYLNQGQYDVVLFSNDNFYADQAWILCNRLDYKNLHVLKGGVNEWYNTIINPLKPAETMPAEAFELYTFRKAASMYFGVAYPEQFKTVIKKAPPKPKKVITVKKKKKAPAEGGC
ncbi:MAG: rhodanese-like domain-containing protein [Lutibacter sp.]|uniref:rhodanese-like domain-containing protein n=1 Tax=Lutibacter sp. TaxID=1925666 RepID=UPI00182E27DB|nr:rhodanese-like domain-containing protein [Lutibacter sp.]MBT8317135.1 rhodanese-like domain-containing protein [Lutibacter sp.]NNJ57995.1 rhodanese-like domain-containing protein [Lutibacter sp.]